MATIEDVENELRKKILDEWIEIAEDLGVEYIQEEIEGELMATPVDPAKAMLKQFGSATLGVPAEFYIEKGLDQLAKKVKNG